MLARARPTGRWSRRADGSRFATSRTDGSAYRAAARNLEVAAGATAPPRRHVRPVAAPLPSAAPSGAKPARARRAPADAWVAYTDGACSGNPGPAGSGVVLVAPERQDARGLEYLGEATNNVAELTAILRAVEWIPAAARAIVVHTDSQYAIGVLQKGWKAKANGELVARAKRVGAGARRAARLRARAPGRPAERASRRARAGGA